jgi:hypothetical protein
MTGITKACLLECLLLRWPSYDCVYFARERKGSGFFDLEPY